MSEDRRPDAPAHEDRWPAIIVAVPTLVALIAAMRFPFTASPGAAGAQLLAVVGGLALATAVAVRASRRDPRGFADDARWGASAALLILGAWTVASFVSEALRPACGASKGIGPLLVLALPVLLLQGALGAWVGRIAGGAFRATIAVVALELAMLFAMALRFYLAPQWRIVSHPFVVLSTEQLWGSGAPEGAETLRAATLCFALALAAFGVALFPARTGGRPRHPRRAWYLGAALLVTGIVIDGVARRALLPTRAERDATYSYVKTRGLLVLHADPLAVRPDEVDALLADGTLWLDRIAVRLGQRAVEPIHVYVHATSDAKERWTGARRADFAMPWRHEIHVHLGDAPHGTLGHELVHVIAGEPLSTLFRTPGRFVVGVQPALIEGLAVAVTPELKRTSALTILEATAALHRLRPGNDPAALFRGVTFVGESHKGAYAAAGAALSEAARRTSDPAATLRAIYAGGSIAAGLGSADAERDFFASYTRLLDTLSLPDGALAEVAEELGDPSVLRDVCRETPTAAAHGPRLLARSGEMARALAALGAHPSLATVRDLERDARAADDTVGLAVLARALAALDDSLTRAVRLKDAGDLLWQADSARAAQATWTRAPLSQATPAVSRALLSRRLLADALVGAAGSASMAASAMALLQRGTMWASGPEALSLARALERADERPEGEGRGRGEPAPVRALARYLLARRHVLTGRPDAAVPMLTQVLADRLLPAPFVDEALLMQGSALTQLGRGAEAARLLESAMVGSPRRSHALAVADLLERARRAGAAPPRPRLVTRASDPAWADRLLLGRVAP